MTTIQTRGQMSPFLVTIVLLLGAAVFASGIQAKLAHYVHQPGPHPTNLVKLNQDGQEYKKAGALRSANRPNVLQSHPYMRVALFMPRFAVRRNPKVCRYLPGAIPSYSHSLFFRPPPVAC